MESLEMRKARFSKLIYCRKEKFENKGRFPIPSGQLQIREGVFSGWEHCHIQKGVLEPRDGGGQIPKLWVGWGQESWTLGEVLDLHVYIDFWISLSIIFLVFLGEKKGVIFVKVPNISQWVGSLF